MQVANDNPAPVVPAAEGKRMTQLRKTFQRAMDTIFDSVNPESQLSVFPPQLVEQKGALIKDYCTQVALNTRANIEVCSMHMELECMRVASIMGIPALLRPSSKPYAKSSRWGPSSTNWRRRQSTSVYLKTTSLECMGCGMRCCPCRGFLR